MVKETWTLLNGTPSTCINIGLHSLGDEGPVDLVLSGPNFGRNVSNLTFSSGTIGGAIDGVLCGKKAIAISFAFYKGIKFTDEEVAAACETACHLITRLWNTWPADVDLFNINIPIVPVSSTPLKVCLTEIHRITHGAFFKPVQSFSSMDGEGSKVTSFRFAPTFPFTNSHIEPEVGTDAWAVDSKHISVTPIKATWNVCDLSTVKKELGAEDWILPPQ
jgi:5'/3'-nucleotidase SurE